VRSQGDYVGGKKNGCWETWHENGENESKGTWSDDVQVLTWLNWSNTGNKSKQTLGAGSGGELERTTVGLRRTADGRVRFRAGPEEEHCGDRVLSHSIPSRHGIDNPRLTLSVYGWISVVVS